MDVYELLKADHRETHKTFQKLLETSEHANKKREELFSQLKHALRLHTTLEQDIFYPPLKENDRTRDLIQEALREHRAVAEQLDELERVPKNTKRWATQCRDLMDKVEHHAQEEENGLFPKARQIFSPDQATRMGEEIAARKEDKAAGSSRR